MSDEFSDLASSEDNQGRARLYEIRNPELARLILKDQSLPKPPHALEILERPLGASGLITDHGPGWKPARALITPLLLPHASDDKLNNIIIEQSGALVERWREAHGPLDLEYHMRRLTADIMCKAMFGETLTEADIEPLLGAVVIATHPSGLPAQIELIRNTAPLPDLSELEHQAISYIDEIMYRQIAGHRTAARETPQDILDHLIAFKAPGTEEPYSDRQIRDHLVTLLIAGHDTTAVGLTYAVRQLAKDPSMVEAVRAQTKSVLQGGALAPAHLVRLRYASHIFLEALRLHPPVHQISRVASQDMVIGSLRLRKGDVLGIPVAAINRDPAIWDRPDEFIPSRFEQKGLLGKAFLPFSMGPRVCPGQLTSLREATAAISLLCSSFNLSMASDCHEKNWGLTMRPAGRISIRSEPRAPQ